MTVTCNMSKLLATVSFVLLVVTVVRGTPARGGGATESTAAGELNLMRATGEAIEGEYYGSDGLAIHFLSNEERVSISTFGYGDRSSVAEKQLLALEGPPELGNWRMMNILGAEMLYYNTTVDDGTLDDKSEIVEFFVPHRYKAYVSSAIKYQNRDKLHRVSKRLHRDDTSIESAAKEMLEHPAMLVLQETMFALGESGLEGRDYPAALKLYVVSMRLLEWRGKVLEDDSHMTREQGENDYFAALRRQKRSHCRKCKYGSCPDRYHKSNCLGLCGRRCSCWRWVCGDCCFHRGCYEHDLCCKKCGFWSWYCLGVSGFKKWCNRHFPKYPRCIRKC